MIEKGKNLQTLLGDFNDTINQEKLLHHYFKSNKQNLSDSETLEHSLLDKTAEYPKKANGSSHEKTA